LPCEESSDAGSADDELDRGRRPVVSTVVSLCIGETASSATPELAGDDGELMDSGPGCRDGAAVNSS